MRKEKKKNFFLCLFVLSERMRGLWEVYYDDCTAKPNPIPEEPPCEVIQINSRSYKCPKCPKIFSTRGSVVQHMKYNCNRKMSVACPYCQQVFVYPFSAYKHIRQIHPGYRVYCNMYSSRDIGNGC